MKKKVLSLFLLFALVLIGCSPAKSSEMLVSDQYMSAAVPQEAPSAGRDFSDYGESTYNTAEQGSVDTPQVNRLVIRNADLSIVVIEPTDALGSINQMAERMGGYVVSSNLWKSTNYNGVELPEANVTIRVPAQLLNPAIDEIKNLTENRDVDVLSENVSGQDVTKEYTDLNSQLKNLEDAEEKLREILDEANKTEDVLNVFNQLTYYREQIEVTKGQIKYYEESAALSAISVRIQAQEAVNPITVAGWKPSVTLSKALQALVNGLQVVVDVLIWIIVTILPIMLVILLPLYLIFLLIRSAVRRSSRKRKEKSLREANTPDQNK
jgi:hypothetical protein